MVGVGICIWKTIENARKQNSVPALAQDWEDNFPGDSLSSNWATYSFGGGVSSVSNGKLLLTCIKNGSQPSIFVYCVSQALVRPCSIIFNMFYDEQATGNDFMFQIFNAGGLLNQTDGVGLTFKDNNIVRVRSYDEAGTRTNGATLTTLGLNIIVKIDVDENGNVSFFYKESMEDPWQILELPASVQTIDDSIDIAFSMSVSETSGESFVCGSDYLVSDIRNIS